MFRSYGSSLPTSLTYIILSTRGSSPWRPDADMGTIRCGRSTWPSPGFSRSEGRIQTPPQVRCSSRSKPYLPARGFQGPRTLTEKRKLSPDLPTASPGHFGLPRRAFEGPYFGNGSATGFRNRNRIPFRPKGALCEFNILSPQRRAPIDLGFHLGLRIDSLLSNSCSQETLLHVSPPGPHWSICYYHQDLRLRRLQAGSRRHPSVHTAATLLLVKA